MPEDEHQQGEENEHMLINNIDRDACRAWDDQTGEELPWRGVLGARKEEMVEIHKHKIYCKIPSKNVGTKREKHQSKQDG